MLKKSIPISIAGLCFWASCERIAIRSDRMPGPERILQLEQFCEQGSGNDCYKLGFMYEHGQGVEASSIKSGAYYRRACKLGLSFACPHNQTPTKSPLMAEEESIDACKQGNKDDCAKVSAMAMRYFKEERNTKRAIELWAVSCGQGDSAACYNVGIIAEAVDVRVAARMFLAACKLGSADGCLRGAKILAKSQAKEDLQLAVEMVKKACEGGLSEGCQISDEILRLRCDEAQDYEACGEYAVWLAVGRGRRPDYARARQYAQKACRGGIKATCQLAKESMP